MVLNLCPCTSGPQLVAVNYGREPASLHMYFGNGDSERGGFTVPLGERLVLNL